MKTPHVDAGVDQGSPAHGCSGCRNGEPLQRRIGKGQSLHREGPAVAMGIIEHMGTRQVRSTDRKLPRVALSRRWRDRQSLLAVGGILIVVLGIVVWVLANFGSVRGAWLYAMGARVMVEPRLVALPDGRVGDTRTADFSGPAQPCGPARNGPWCGTNLLVPVTRRRAAFL